VCDSCNQVRKNLSQPIGKRTHIPTKVLIYWCVSPSIFRSLFRHFCFENLVTKYYTAGLINESILFHVLLRRCCLFFQAKNKKKNPVETELNWTARDPAKCFTSHSTLLPSQTWNLKKKKKKNVEFETVGVELVDDWLYTSRLSHIWIFFKKLRLRHHFVCVCAVLSLYFVMFSKRGEWNDTISK
jgi:hypothetical protein